MAADTYGNDIDAVIIPLTGLIAYAPFGTAIPTPTEGGAADLVLAEAFRKVGLISEDGGPEWDEAPDGDALEFWQSGYSIPSGLANVSMKFTAAEESPATRRLRTGKTPDANGYLTVDGGGNSERYVWVTEEVYANGFVRRRAFVGRIKTAKLVKSERGSVQGTEFEVEVQRSPLFNNQHYGEWVLTPDAE